MQGKVSRVRLFQLSIKQPSSPWRWVATNGALKLPLTLLLGCIANVTKIFLQLLCSKQEDMKIKFIQKVTQVNALNCVTAVAA